MLATRILVALGLSLACSSVHGQYRYRVVDLGVLPGSSTSRAIDIDERGVILCHGGWPRRTFVFDPTSGRRTDIGQPTGAQRFLGNKMNDKGQIVGIFLGRSKSGFALYTPGKGFQDLGRLATGRDPNGEAAGLNNRGEVVGRAVVGSFLAEAFRWTAATGMRSLSPGVDGWLWDLDDRGHAIGRYKNLWHYWDGKAFKPLAFIPEAKSIGGLVAGRVLSPVKKLILHVYGGATVSITVPLRNYTTFTPEGVNDLGLMVGNSHYRRKTTYYSRPFLYEPGRGLLEDFSKLVAPGWTIEWLEDVNNRGQIVGLARNASTKAVHGVLLQPTAVAAANPVGSGCGGPGSKPPALSSSAPALGKAMTLMLTRGTALRAGRLWLGAPATIPIGGCTLRVTPVVTLPIRTDQTGTWSTSLPVPTRSDLLGYAFALQAGLAPTSGPLGFDLTNGIHATVGL